MSKRKAKGLSPINKSFPYLRLLIPIDYPVSKNGEKHYITAKMEETFIRLHNPFINLLMRF